MDQKVTLTIDGREVTVPAGTTVLDAASQVGIDIPTFCHHAKLVPVGACRMCLVEIEKVRGLQPACSTSTRPEMVVHTNTEEIVKARQAQLEFLLTNHPLDCPVCDAGGECDLQDQTFRFGPGKSRFIEEKRHKTKALPLNDHLIMDQERCVVCRRCERFLREWADDVQIAAIERGSKSYMATFNGEPMSTLFSGNTAHVCPVGAITSRLFRFSARCWELEVSPSICDRCAVGCNISLHSKYNRLKRIVTRPHDAVNDEWLCDRGQFDHSFADAGARVTQPMLRVDGELKPVSWEEALAHTSDTMGRIVTDHGPKAIAAIGSPWSSNEANYLLQRLARAAWHTNNISFQNTPPPKTRLLPTTRLLDSAGVIVLVGLDLADTAPLLELLGRHGGVTGCTRFLVIHSQKTHLARFGSWLECRPGQEGLLLNALAYLLIQRGKAAPVPNLESLKGWVSAYTPAAVSKTAGLTTEALTGALELMTGHTNRLVLFGDQVARDAEAMKAVTNLSLLLSNEGPVYIPAEANGIGVLDMGLAPEGLPGGQSYKDQRVVDRLIQLWGRSKLPTEPGLPLSQMITAIEEGALKAAFVLGRLPAGWGEVASHLEYLVVQTGRLADIPPEAHVVLPAASHAEAEGTFTNLSGRVQLALPGLRPVGESRAEWWIMSQLGARCGKPAFWGFDSAGAVFSEIAKVVPAYAGLSYAGLGQEGRLRAAEPIRFTLAESRAAL